MEIYYEQNVNNSYIDKHKKRYTVLSVLSKVFLVLGILIAMLYFLLAVDFSTPLGTLIQLLIMVLISSPFIGGYFIIRRYLRNTNSEYDYMLNGGILRVVRIIERKKRKLLATVAIASIEAIGKVTSESYERYAGDKTLKKQFAVCNYENEDGIVYIRYRQDGINYLLLIEPDNEMITSLKRSIPRISIMDKSLLNLAATAQNGNDISR